MERNTNYTLKLDADISNLSKKAEDVKRVLTNIGALGKFPDLDKGLENLFKKIDKIKSTASQPVTNATFTSLSRDTASADL
jgi:hypothetical protein